MEVPVVRRTGHRLSGERERIAGITARRSLGVGLGVACVVSTAPVGVARGAAVGRRVAAGSAVGPGVSTSASDGSCGGDEVGVPCARETDRNVLDGPGPPMLGETPIATRAQVFVLLEVSVVGA